MIDYKKALVYFARNKMLCAIYFILPIPIALLIYSIFYIRLPTELPIGVIDGDKSGISREVEFNLDSTSTLRVVKKYNSILEAKADLNEGNIYGLVIIPNGLEKNIKLGIETKIGFYYNAQFVLIGKALDSSFLKVIATMNAKNDTIRKLIKSSNFEIAFSGAMPVVSTIGALYNPSNDYAQFLITLILPCAWQILIALGMLNAIGKISGAKKYLLAFGMNVVVSSFWGMAMMVFFQTIGYPMNGSYNVLFLGILAMSCAISGIVMFVQAFLHNMAKSVGVIAAYTAPGLAFAGITYPQNAMDGFALFWSHILPISYFMELYLQQANYGLDSMDSLKVIAKMLPFFVFFPLGVLIEHLRGQK
ncbi:ABC transporter permease [Helicobacter cappadocius]|uniref:ABC transporter permease n=1 Tax=Helicobacter cappadocius TaxID=3063998 RepID=A0AA90PK62_9HELI|nr:MULTISPECIES: ABC transporter permease [unclassified Helicobacter]MDO7252985.1 ABC transporter permease [Helicobacter sp. faydin-H75]MDP2539025.1 ABC transporter permease [Helicobacter sp. faydin-H76]